MRELLIAATASMCSLARGSSGWRGTVGGRIVPAVAAVRARAPGLLLPARLSTSARTSRRAAPTFCACKGPVSYWPAAAARRDAGPRPHGVFRRAVDVIAEGERRERPITPWSPRRAPLAGTGPRPVSAAGCPALHW